MKIIPSPCYTCGSLECSPLHCRFRDTVSSSPLDFELPRDEEIDEEAYERKEFDRHPERYR